MRRDLSVSVSTQVDTWRLRLTAEDFQSHGSSGAAVHNINS